MFHIDKSFLLVGLMLCVVAIVLLTNNTGLYKLQDFQIKQNLKIIQNSDRNYDALVNITKAGAARTALIINQYKNLLSNITGQIQNTQNDDDRILQQIVLANQNTNNTINSLGGLKSILSDIHKSRIQVDKNSKILDETLRTLNSSATKQQGERNHELLVKILDQLTKINNNSTSNNNTQ